MEDGSVKIQKDKMLEDSIRGNGKLVGECSVDTNTRSWVVKMEKLLERANPTVEMARWKQQSIYQVPMVIKKQTNEDAYQPQFVSLGPLHHGETHLQPMEKHKRRAVLHMANRAGKPIQEFVAAISEVAGELQGAYGELDDKWRGGNTGLFVEMMVTDGCFLLELIRKYEILREGKEDYDYAPDDPIFSRRSFFTWWSKIRNDMIAVENQQPLVVLQRLLTVQRGTSPRAGDINRMVLSLLNRRFEEGMDSQLGLHFLDLYHSSYCGVHPQPPHLDYEPRTPCAVELSEAGIQFKNSEVDNIHAIDFENGVLSMPPLKFHNETETLYLNLMAFEWLHPDARDKVVCSYMSFMDKVIESERDVALLRSNGLLENMIGSDRKVVKTFNILTKLARTPGRGSRLGHVNRMVNDHCRKKRNKWRAIFMNTYLSNPWVFISMVAAVILLVATLLQTVYTIVPFYTKG
ncbi:hypothetical protein BS78_K157500 [Paspalum vaginatum]|uniref:Uncharacterized protein n=1 Tax=Paspalum vaginatum TaxID=158149 RepID=A0A9W8CDY4_9POAL|nr:hypothetical protein BS78_K157500 [Paspalum vaginatum]